MKFFKKFQCDTCHTKFGKEEELMQHKQIIHNKDTPYDCKKCDLFFDSMEAMRAHLQQKHSYKNDR